MKKSRHQKFLYLTLEKANLVEPDKDDGDHLEQPPVLRGESTRAETLPTSQVPAKENAAS